MQFGLLFELIVIIESKPLTEKRFIVVVPERRCAFFGGQTDYLFAQFQSIFTLDL